MRRQKNGSAGGPTAPKSETDLRSMAVPPLRFDRLREHLGERVCARAKSAIVLTSAKGKEHTSASRWNSVWGDRRKAVDGLTEGDRFHDLQHTGLTRSPHEGATLAELMRHGEQYMAVKSGSLVIGF
ncbi:hypothetical protein [Paraoerskovia marina]|uniref:hypothetical protein n=1 Tax=Paraoerskovia marina TaxID=545619 RepID=UPI001B7FF5FD|nr:hypothetical protein [Paraoerskovia marina]